MNQEVDYKIRKSSQLINILFVLWISIKQLYSLHSSPFPKFTFYSQFTFHNGIGAAHMVRHYNFYLLFFPLFCVCNGNIQNIQFTFTGMRHNNPLKLMLFEIITTITMNNWTNTHTCSGNAESKMKQQLFFISASIKKKRIHLNNNLCNRI